jgi:hypothetical protein
VVLESLAETSPELAASITPELAASFKEADITVKGDILYALGESGDLNTKQTITEIMKGVESPDLQEAAREAVASINERY